MTAGEARLTALLRARCRRGAASDEDRAHRRTLTTSGTVTTTQLLRHNSNRNDSNNNPLTSLQQLSHPRLPRATMQPQLVASPSSMRCSPSCNKPTSHMTHSHTTKHNDRHNNSRSNSHSLTLRHTVRRHSTAPLRTSRLCRPSSLLYQSSSLLSSPCSRLPASLAHLLLSPHPQTCSRLPPPLLPHSTRPGRHSRRRLRLVPSARRRRLHARFLHPSRRRPALVVFG